MTRSSVVGSARRNEWMVKINSEKHWRSVGEEKEKKKKKKEAKGNNWRKKSKERKKLEKWTSS